MKSFPLYVLFMPIYFGKGKPIGREIYSGFPGVG
jgi:hypothetical protein